MTVAFALSGGGNLGPMQAGAVVALLEAGITPDVLVGTSVGALNAAFLSSRPGLSGAQNFVDAWATLRRHEVASFSPIDLLAGFFGVSDHLLAASRLRALIRKWVEIEVLEDAKTSVAIVATDALSGEAVVLQRGDVLEAVSASAAIPALLPSVRMGDRWLIDGSLSAGCPVLQAQDLGADDVYMITTATAPRLRPPPWRRCHGHELRLPRHGSLESGATGSRSASPHSKEEGCSSCPAESPRHLDHSISPEASS